jgi:hypothetical protein
VTETTLPALNGDDTHARLDDSERQGVAKAKPNAVVNISLPLMGLDTPGLRIPEWITTSVQVDLSRGLLITGHCVPNVSYYVFVRSKIPKTYQ